MSSTGDGPPDVEIEIELEPSRHNNDTDPIVMESVPTKDPPKEDVIVTDVEGDDAMVREKKVDMSPANAKLEEIGEPEVTVIGTAPEKDSEDKKKGDVKSANVFKLFRYATILDFLFMTLGALAAIGHGLALPALMFVFGDLTNSFINQAISRQIVPPLNNGTVDCSAGLNPLLYNLSVSQIVATFTNNSVDFMCDYVVTPSSTFTDLIGGCGQEATCLSDDDFIFDINNQVYGFVGIAIAVFILANVQIAFFQLACERQVQKIRLLYYRAILRQEVGWFDAHPSGELASRLSDDIGKIHDGIGDKVALLLQWLATFAGGFIVGFVRDWRLTLLLLVFTPFLAIGGFIMSKLVSTFASQEQKEYASAGAVAEEVLSSIRTVVSFGGEFKEVDRYNGKLKQARRLGLKKGLSVGVSLGFVFFLIFLVDAAAFWFGGFLISIRLTQGGDVVAVFFAVLIGAFALGQAGPNIENLLTAAGSAGTIFATIDRVPQIDSSSSEGAIPEKFNNTIELRKVCFSYPTRPDIQVMDDISLKVDVGKTFALVGASGCGKSTVVQLIQRFYDVASGQVLVGGTDVRDLNLKWLRSNIGVVSQEPVLFDTSIAENIRYGNEDISLEGIIKAAKDANAHEFISSLPDGYDTLVGERGTQLSGGQKQRIAIARALVRDPKILLLDEATSALDTESESIVQQALDRAREGRTTIVVAHRLSTIQSADVIVSIEEGRVVEMGTHAELMDKEGLYFDLVTAQTYAADENFALVEAMSPTHHASRRSFRRRTGSGSESAGGISRQDSIKKQVSIISEGEVEESSSRGLKRMASKKEQEEWDKEIPEVPLWRVLRLNLKEWWVIILGLLGATVNGSIWPMFALLFGEILKVFQAQPEQIAERINLWGGLFILLGVISGTGVFLKIVCFSVSGENLTSRLRSRSFKAMLRQEIGWFDNERNSSGALVTRLANDASQVQGATGARLGTLIETFIGMILGLVIAFVYTWVLTLVILAVVPIVVIAGSLEVKALTGQAGRNKEDLEKAGKVAVDSIENIRTVASLGVEENFNKQYQHHLSGPYKKALLNCFVYGLTYAVSQCVIYFMYAVVFRFGAWQVTLMPGDTAYSSFDRVFVAFSALIFGAAGAGQAGAFAPNYAKAKLSANRIFFLLDKVPEIDGYSEEGSKPDQETVTGAVSVAGVNFNYPSRPDVKVLQGLDLEVKPGKTLALVGPSGCGKSTVVSLLERFYDPVSGILSLDGVDTRDLNIRWLRNQIGIVSQEPILFDTSIADNIRYGANYREVSDDEVIDAAKAANIHNFVETLPQGYNTNVGAKGTQLSGGQKQRVAIARAIIRDPKILLLDEATSALDTEGEKIVQDALDRAQKGRTSVVIAHRLSTIYNADCIVVISGGRAVEAGTHSELLEKKGIYYRLNRYQMVKKDHEGSSGDL